MINDLVKTNKGEVIKVESISTKRQHRKVGYHKEDDPCHIKYVRQGYLFPILITKEILIGLKFTDCGKAGLQRLPDELAHKHLTFYLEECLLGVGFILPDCEVSLVRNIFYVHQFQQALRLCELHELADNIKL